MFKHTLKQLLSTEYYKDALHAHFGSVWMLGTGYHQHHLKVRRQAQEINYLSQGSRELRSESTALCSPLLLINTLYPPIKSLLEY